MATVTIKGKDERITLPKQAVMWELSMLARRSDVRACLAALGLCTRAGKMSGLDLAAYKGDLVAYADDIGETLDKMGLSMIEAIGAGAACLTAIKSALIGEAEVEEAVGNSAPQKEDSP
jgi:hypothetical protein